MWFTEESDDRTGPAIKVMTLNLLKWKTIATNV